MQSYEQSSLLGLFRMYFHNKQSYTELDTLFTRTEIKNPLNIDDDCILHTTKKIDKYKHSYDPEPYIKQLRDIGMTDDIISKFVLDRQTKCCKVIAISLYFPKYLIENMKKYIYSIYRTVKNVERNLRDWIVRLYLDKSVYKCILNFDTEELVDEKKELRTVQEKFNYILESPNVELYTYMCNDASIALGRTRMLRFMPMVDSEVALCVVREADGFVSNLDCHNIKLFDISNKLFYLPQIDNNNSTYHAPMCGRYRTFYGWIQIYMASLEREYFNDKILLYNLQAGLFSIKLKLKENILIEHISILNKKIKDIVNYFRDEKPNVQPCVIEDDYLHHLKIPFDGDSYCLCNFALYIYDNVDDLQHILNIGFDEILLSDMFKEIISFPFPLVEGQEDNIINLLKIHHGNTLLTKKLNLFFQYDISKINYGTLSVKYYKNRCITLEQFYSSIIDDLQEKKIISIEDKQYIINKILEYDHVGGGSRQEILKNFSMIDTLLSYIRTDAPSFEIILLNNARMSLLLNTPYDLQLDNFYPINHH